MISIQANVPRCPDCGSAITLNKITLVYMCFHCGGRYKIVGYGHTEREFLCEKMREVGNDG